jgi:glycosyltransferase involved in cell wall biosynthesis
MRCPTLKDLPPPSTGKTGWPWTEESLQLPDVMPNGSPWPKVSIVIPSYNQGEFIEEAIRSVLLQGYPDLELIIIDGGSTDGSVEIIRKYETWLAYWVSEPDRGQSHAINKGLRRSTGRLFNWHNSDDVFTPNSLAVTVGTMVRHPEASYVHGYSIVIDSQSNILFYNNNNPMLNQTGVSIELAWSVANLKCGCQPGCLMDLALVVEVGMIDESLEFLMDLDLTLRLALCKPPVYVHHPVVYFREHPDSKGFSRHVQRAKSRIIIAHKLFSRQDLPLAIQKLWRKSFARAHHYAAQCYIKADMDWYALWHVLQEGIYSPIGSLKAREEIISKICMKYFSGLVDRFSGI